VRLLGGFNNIAFPHDLTYRPGFATDCKPFYNDSKLNRSKNLNLETSLPQTSVLTMKGLGEEIGSSAWYHALPASPERLQTSHSLASVVSLRRILRAPIPLPYMCVQNLRHRGLSGPERNNIPQWTWHSFIADTIVEKVYVFHCCQTEAYCDFLQSLYV
jgi:hypothetical protein